MRRLLTGITLVAGTMWSAAGSAGADPVKAPRAQGSIVVTCGSQSYEVVVNGNGEFTPAHALGGTTMLIPMAFGDFTGTIRDPEGNVVDSFTEPGDQVKGNSTKKGKHLTSCTFAFTEVGDGSDPELPAGFTFTGEGSVTGMITPAR